MGDPLHAGCGHILNNLRNEVSFLENSPKKRKELMMAQSAVAHIYGILAGISLGYL